MAHFKKLSRQLFFIGIISFLNWTFHSAIASGFEKECTENGGIYHNYGVVDSVSKSKLKGEAYLKTFFAKIPIAKVKNTGVVWGYGGKYLGSSPAEAIMYAIEKQSRNVGEKTAAFFFKQCPEANQFTKEGIEITVEGCWLNDKQREYGEHDYILLKVSAPGQSIHSHLQTKICKFSRKAEAKRV